MYVGGSIWQPPSLNPFGSQVVSTGMTASAALASASTANVQGNSFKVGGDSTAADSLAAKKNMLLKHLLKEEEGKDDSKNVLKEKKSLSDRYYKGYKGLLFTNFSAYYKCLYKCFDVDSFKLQNQNLVLNY